MRTRKHLTTTTALALSATALAFQPALAEDGAAKVGTQPQVQGEAGADLQTGSIGANVVENQKTVSIEEREDAQEVVDEGARVVTQMRGEAELTQAIDQAKGVFIVPDYGKGAFLVGGAGGEGVLLTKAGGEWSAPVFYNIGALSVGVEAGASGGSIGMLLMTDEAVQSFKQRNNFSLNANADLTLVDWSANAQANWGKGDVVMWADTEGLFAGVGLSASDIVYDNEATEAFYGNAQPDPSTLLRGTAEVDDSAAEELRSALAG